MNDDSQPERSMLITELHTDSGVRLLPFGEIDMATVGQVRDAIIAVLARNKPPAIVLDLQYVSFIDSTGIRTLIVEQMTLRERDSDLVVVNASSRARRVFEMVDVWRTLSDSAVPGE